MAEAKAATTEVKAASFGGGHRERRPRFEGRPEAPEKQFDERTIHIDRVARVVKGGRRFRFRSLVVVGDHKGRVGVGIAKGADVSAATAKATEVAKKQMIKVNLNGDTIVHDSDAKKGGARVLLMPASAGTGLIAGGVVRTILEVAGISNALSKSFGSTNKVNIAYATLSALDSLVPRSDWVIKPKPAATKAKVNKVEKKK